MRILITGGLGFIGKSLTNNLLLDKRNHIFIIDNFQYGKEDEYTKGAVIFRGDVRDKHNWENIPQVDYVYHLAAPSSVILFNNNLTESINTTIRGFLNCINWSLHNHVKKIIYASSGSVYGNTKEVCSETTTPSPINAYGKAKLVCEYIAKLYGEMIPMLGLRIFAGFGPQEDQKGEFASVITLFYRQLLEGRRPIIYGNGLQSRDFVYIDDIVSVLMTVMHDNTLGVLNVGSGKSTTFNQVMATLNTCLNLKINPQYIKYPPNYLLHTKADIINMEKKYPDITSFRDGITKYISSSRL